MHDRAVAFSSCFCSFDGQYFPLPAPLLELPVAGRVLFRDTYGGRDRHVAASYQGRRHLDRRASLHTVFLLHENIACFDSI